MLVRNEEWTIRWALWSIAEFCDVIYVFDNRSTDKTPQIIEQETRHNQKIIYQQVEHPRESHYCLEPLAGTPSWVFAVDGDEIYDAQKLATLRPRILKGEFDDNYKLTGNCIHVESLDVKNYRVRGYACPPAKAVTKLYNFNAIEYWRNVPNERLHDGEIKFRDGYTDDSRLHFWHEYDWEATPMRCLHLCFMNRSSHDDPTVKARANISDVASANNKKRSLWKRLKNLTNGQRKISAWKEDQYRKGELQEKDLSPFVYPTAAPFLDKLNSDS